MSKRAKHDGLFQRIERTLLGVLGVASGEVRTAVLAGGRPATLSNDLRVLLDKVERAAWTVTPEELALLRKAMSDDELFDLILCAGYGAVKRRHVKALAAIDEAWS